MSIAKAQGRNLYYECHEEASSSGARPLLLIMGMAGSCAGWLPLQVPEFSKGRRVIIFDHRGIGQSEDTGEPFTTADLARDALALLDYLEIQEVDVLGAFMGGMTAQELALLAPERIGRLVLVGTYARADKKRQMLLKHWSQLMETGLSPETFIFSRLLWALHEDTLEQGDLIQAMTDFYRKEGAPYTADLFVRQCQACSEHDSLDRVNAISQPTLVVGGAEDILTPAKFLRELAERIPDSRLVSMSYGGHLVMVESAERFNRLVLQFLDEEQ
ncbi:MAG: alpha/beta hydrolase [Myxococcota bacterium]|nr:alpha/beta hydrolase [Myxococcota bacterium]